MIVCTALYCSPTFDEAAYLPAGISHWEQGRFDLYRACPHLVRTFAAVPVLWMEPATDWGKYEPGVGRMPEFAVGRDFIAANGSRVYGYFFVARLMCIPLSLIGAWVCYRWASELYGAAAGTLALALWCFDPNIVAHGSLITSDVATASLGVLCLFLFRRWLLCPSWSLVFATGGTLGLLLLTRASAVLMLLLMPVLWILWQNRLKQGWQQIKQPLAQMICILAVGIYVLNLGYLFDGSLRTLGEYQFASQSLAGEGRPGNRFQDTWLGHLPVPLPEDYVLGVDTLKRNFETNSKLAYLGGQFQQLGWWYYYLYGMMVKVPLGTWLLVLLALTLGWRYRSRLREELFLLVPPVAYLVFLSSQVGLNSHVRYALPIAPFVFIWTSKIALAFTSRRFHRHVAVATGIGLVLLIASSIRIVPHGLAYFNELAGGPLRGHDHLLDSNIDWGQDLKRLSEWLERHPEVQDISIAYFGSYSPADVGIAFRLPPKYPLSEEGEVDNAMEFDLQPGWYAISVNFLRGYRFAIFDGEGNRQWLSQPSFSYFQQFAPVDRAGYSIYIYHLTIDDARRFRDEQDERLPGSEAGHER